MLNGKKPPFISAIGYLVIALGLFPAILWNAVATQPLFEKPHTPSIEEGRTYRYLIGKSAGSQIVYLTKEEYDQAHRKRIYSILLGVCGVVGGVLVSLAQRRSTRKEADFL